MAFLAGENLTAGRVNRLAPKPYWAQANNTLPASSSAVDVPGASITFSTETAGATVVVNWQAAFYHSGVAGALNSVVAVLDTSTVAPMVAFGRQQANTDNVQGAATWQTTIASAGSHTIKLRGTTGTNCVIQIYTALSITVYEVV